MRRLPEVKQKAKGGKKHRKHGRNALRCKVYQDRNQRERNKVVRIAKHLRRFPGDGCARNTLQALRTTLGMRAAA